MKRIGNIYSKVYEISNLQLADAKARKGKKLQYGVILHDRNRESNIRLLSDMLKNKTYKTAEYIKFMVFDPKEREVYKLPYFPDRITHHAIMNILEDMFVANFTADTYSCIKGRGVHAASNAVKKALVDTYNTEYCLKIDVKKFYPSIDHQTLKVLLRRKIKDQDLLWLLDEIIDSADGLPIGNYLSQYFANFYLSGFDHWIKEEKKAKYYFRYADDIVVLSGSKEELHQLLWEIDEYLAQKLKLCVKKNYQIFPVESRGIDFLGYVFYHTHTLLRKRTKKRFAIMLKRRKNQKSINSYYGWAKHCNSRNLLKKLLDKNTYGNYQKIQGLSGKRGINRT